MANWVGVIFCRFAGREQGPARTIGEAQRGGQNVVLAATVREGNRQGRCVLVWQVSGIKVPTEQDLLHRFAGASDLTAWELL